jgi:hypothetical protein
MDSHTKQDFSFETAVKVQSTGILHAVIVVELQVYSTVTAKLLQ